MEPTPHPALTLPQRIALQGLVTRCPPGQTYQHCVQEVASWVGIRSSELAELLGSALRSVYRSDDVQGACAAFLTMVRERPDFAETYTVPVQSFDQKFRDLPLRTKHFMLGLGHLPSAPANFAEAAQRVAETAGRPLVSVRETMALALALLFPTLTTPDDRVDALYKVTSKQRTSADVPTPLQPPNVSIEETPVATPDEGPRSAPRAPSKKLTLPQRIALQGLVTRCPPGQTYQHCVQEVADWINIRASRLEPLLVGGLRSFFPSDAVQPHPAANAQDVLATFRQGFAATPDIARWFTVDDMSLDEKFRGLSVASQRFLMGLRQLPSAPANFVDAAQRVADAVGQDTRSVRETMALALAVLFPDLATPDDRLGAYYRARPEAWARRPSPQRNAAGGKEAGEDQGTAERDRRVGRHDARALQRRYDGMTDRDKFMTYELAEWTVRGGGPRPVSTAEARRLFEELFPDVRNVRRCEHELLLALKQHRLVLKDKRHQVTFLVDND